MELCKSYTEYEQSCLRTTYVTPIGRFALPRQGEHLLPTIQACVLAENGTGPHCGNLMVAKRIRYPLHL